MKHIVQVKSDNGVLSVRIPALVAARFDIKKGDFVVCQPDRAGRLRYRKLENEINYGHEPSTD